MKINAPDLVPERGSKYGEIYFLKIHTGKLLKKK
jgi:hypothetical protein